MIHITITLVGHTPVYTFSSPRYELRRFHRHPGGRRRQVGGDFPPVHRKGKHKPTIDIHSTATPLQYLVYFAQHANTFDLSAFTQSGQWPTIWAALFRLLADPQAPTGVHEDCLHALRILSRDRTHLNATTDAQFDALLRLADLGVIEQPDAMRMPDAVRIESLKTMCNLVFQSPHCQQMCLGNSAIAGIVRRLRYAANMPVAQQLLYFDMKLLFIITALNEATRPKLRRDLYGLTYLSEALEMAVPRNTVAANGDSGDGRGAPQPPLRLTDTQVDYVCEVLKVLFNITFGTENVRREEADAAAAELLRLATCLHDLLLCRAMNRDKQQELCSHTVNLLTNIPIVCYTELAMRLEDRVAAEAAAAAEAGAAFEGHDVRSLDVLLGFLRQRLTSSESKTRVQQRELLTPVLVVLLKAVRCAPVQRRYVRQRVLPPLRGDDVRRRPEVGDELRNHLVRLLTTAEVHVRDLAAELLFVLCKENVWRMTKYTGYGNAAGMFANRGLLGGGVAAATAAPAGTGQKEPRAADAVAYSSDSEDSDTEEYRRVQHEINPVLGSVEPPRSGDPFEGMSDEQREHEAMQLVGLMEKLHRTGMVQPCRVGEDGRPVPVQHVLELLEPGDGALQKKTVPLAKGE